MVLDRCAIVRLKVRLMRPLAVSGLFWRLKGEIPDSESVPVTNGGCIFALELHGRPRTHRAAWRILHEQLYQICRSKILARRDHECIVRWECAMSFCSTLPR